MTRELIDSLTAMSSDEAFSFFARGQAKVDWQTVPSAVELHSGGRVRFDRRRRQAVIDHPGRGTSVIDLGARDRTRSGTAIFSPDLITKREGPLWPLPRRSGIDTPFGELAFRDPTDPRARRGTSVAPATTLHTWQYVDAHDRPRLIVTGSAEKVATFYAFTMHDGARYASLRTTSGLGCFYQAGRAGFMKAVSKEAIELARAEGLAEVATNAGIIGVLFDCGGPGDYLTLHGHDRTGRLTCVAVDLRRPSMKDGAIVDP